MVTANALPVFLPFSYGLLLTSKIRHYTMVLDLRHVIPSAEFSSGGAPAATGGAWHPSAPPVATRMAARNIVCDVPRRQQHSADLLRQLHWLPMRSRVDFKLAALCYEAYKLQQPSYLAYLLSSYQQPHDLRSTGLDLLSTQASSTTIGARRFSCAAPAIWNTSPISVRSADTLTCFRSRLKTYLFSRHVQLVYLSAPLTAYLLA